MRIAVWKTNHPIADTVAEAVYYGLGCHSYETISGPILTSKIENIDRYDIHIGYGILRKMDEVFRECDRQGKPWFCVDRGYFKPGHYDGYYRVSLRGTQQTGGWPSPDYERWKRLELEIESRPETNRRSGMMLYCPPTLHVAEFFTAQGWVDSIHEMDGVIRHKGDNSPIDWNGFRGVKTFNSSVGWEALRRGIPVESDPLHSLVGAWAKTHDLMATRRELFATMSAMQLTLDEMRSGMLWPLMQKLLDADNLNKA